jgi:hypothetical protein
MGSRIKARLAGQSSRVSWAAFSFATALVLSAPSAQAETGTEKAKSGAKGTVGLALLGAETVLTVEALIGVKPWWGYVIGGAVGAIGGGVGGYFIDRMDKPAVSMGLLAGGLTLAVPATLAVLSATAYRPEKNPEIDQGAQQTGARDNQIALMQALVERHAFAHERRQVGLFNLGARDNDVQNPWGLAMPELNIVPAITAREAQMARLAQLQDGPNAPSFRSVLLNLAF